MDRGTPFSLRVRQSLGEELLDAATELLTANGFQGLRMADVGTAVGVSRQTVYNEFGTAGKGFALRACDGAAVPVPDFAALFGRKVSAVGHCLLLTDTAPDSGHMIVRLYDVLTGKDAADLLPFLTIKAQPLLDSATEVVRRHLQRCVPGLDAPSADLFAESVVRLVLSHLLMPTAQPREAVAGVVAALVPPQVST